MNKYTIDVPEIIEIDPNKAITFLNINQKLPRSLVCLGSIHNDKIVAVVVFTLPSKNLMNRYSCELKYIKIDDDYVIDNFLNIVTDFYINNYYPSDIYIKKELINDYIGNLNDLTYNNDTDGYEWINPNVTYYNYKISATDSEKYYYGLSHVNIPNATIEDCLNDNYYGSGGLKFKNWFKKHKDYIVKEIIGLYPLKAEAYHREKELVGELYKNDPLCLNSCVGGMDVHTPRNYKKSLEKLVCEIHGETLHQGDICCKCSGSKSISIKKCEIHGDVKHRGDNCINCSMLKLIIIKLCEIHGETKHKGDSCVKCTNSNNIKIKTCIIHGDVKHIGSKCYLCTNNSMVVLQYCAKHGDTKHQGDKCVKCTNTSLIQLKSVRFMV